MIKMSEAGWVVVLAGMFAFSCSAKESADSRVQSKVLFDFDSGSIREAVHFENTKGELIEAGKSGALQVIYPADSLYKKVYFEPTEAWDVSGLGDCALVLEARNPSKESAQLFLTIKSGKQSVTSHVSVGAGQVGTFYFDLAGLNQKRDLGMIGWPRRKAGDLGRKKTRAIPFQYAWGDRVLDLSAIHQIGLYMKGNLTERELVFDDIRIVSNPTGDAADLKGLVDPYGQYTGAEWRGKVQSDEDLKKQAKREAKALSKKPKFKDRSKFGGWSEGPHLKATGYFRTEKVNGKWSLVDPEGYLYFGTGIANSRFSNTSTITGMDYEDAQEHTGLRVADALRRNMFTWLPEKDDPLATHYGYAGHVHTGPLKQGQTFSFYMANVQRKYGENYLDDWRDTSIERMRHWGFTCFGNWTDARFYGNGKVPYFAHVWLSGDHKRVSTGNDYWAPMHDPFDPEFAQSVKTAIKRLDEQVKGDPWCVGIFVENELSWGNEGSDATRFGLVINAMSRDAAESPAKAAFAELLKAKYETVERLNEAWGTELVSWDALLAGFTHEGAVDGERREDFSMLAEALATEYFKVVNAELKGVMPHHLFCGSRFADWGMTPEAVKGAAKYTDVISYNLYTEGLPGHFGDWLAEIDRPSILGEFHFGATDRGMFHGGICTGSDQKDRGVKYRAYMKAVIENPYFVGAHWFQYIDSPTTGRAIDGENYNSGFVSITDTPYEELVKAVQKVNRDLYELRFGQH